MSGAPRRRFAAVAEAFTPDHCGIGRVLWQGSDAVVVATAPGGRIVLWNHAAEVLLGYAPTEAMGLRLAALFPARLPPAVRAALRGDSARASLAGRPVRLVMRHALGTERVVDAALSHGDDAVGRHVVAVIRQVSPVVQREDEFGRHLSTLLAVSQSLGSTLALKPLLDVILQQLRHVADYDGATVALRDDDALVVLANRAGSPTGTSLGAELEGRRLSLVKGAAIWAKLHRRKPVLIRDTRADTALARSYRAVVGNELGARLQAIRAWLAVPLVTREEVTGFIALSHGTQGFYTVRHASLAQGIANHAALAIANARLYEQTQEAMRQANALARIAASVALGGSLDTVLHALAVSVVEATGAVATAVLLADDNPLRLRMVGSHGLPPGYPAAYNQIVRGEAASDNLAVLVERRPRVLRSVWAGLLGRPNYAPIHPFVAQVAWDSIVPAPMVTRDRLVGTLTTYYRPGEEPNADEIAFLCTLADQAAIAVDNARLFVEARDKAALEERTRLAHDLHDSVTQTVFSLGMLARAAQAQHAQRSTKLEGTLDRVAGLAQEALVEMRAMLFELRPVSLIDAGLASALARLVDIARTRTSMAIDYRTTVDVRVAPAAELAMFRIVQEALANATKHARASSASVSLALEGSMLSVIVRDDGIGFDPDVPVVPSADGVRGGLGMESMRARAAVAGILLQIESAFGRGTTISAAVPLADEPSRRRHEPRKD